MEIKLTNGVESKLPITEKTKSITLNKITYLKGKIKYIVVNLRMVSLDHSDGHTLPLFRANEAIPVTKNIFKNYNTTLKIENYLDEKDKNVCEVILDITINE